MSSQVRSSHVLKSSQVICTSPVKSCHVLTCARWTPSIGLLAGRSVPSCVCGGIEGSEGGGGLGVGEGGGCKGRGGEGGGGEGDEGGGEG